MNLIPMAVLIIMYIGSYPVPVNSDEGIGALFEKVSGGKGHVTADDVANYDAKSSLRNVKLREALLAAMDKHEGPLNLSQFTKAFNSIKGSD